MLTLGVTGGLGSGKSTACKIFQLLGCEIFDADEEAKNILFSSDVVKIRLVENFGQTILSDGKIDKITLSEIVFQNQSNQQILNHIIHPLVTEAFLSRKKSIQKQIYIMDAALLFEANLQQYFDKIILIYTDKNIRVERALSRGNLNREQIEYRMNLQMYEEEKMQLADIVIFNNGSEAELKNKITELYKNLM